MDRQLGDAAVVDQLEPLDDLLGDVVGEVVDESVAESEGGGGQVVNDGGVDGGVVLVGVVVGDGQDVELSLPGGEGSSRSC